MDPIRLELMEEWYSRALELPEAELPGFLDKITELHPDQARDLKAMLAGRVGEEKYWDRLEQGKGKVIIETLYERGGLQEGDERGVDLPAGAEVDLPGRIGDFQPLEKLGQGGMGIVYLARQREPVRLVALKLLREMEEAEGLIKRFRMEYRMLALMTHPNIASIYEVGVSEDGRPYFAMEYIDGLSITEFCNQHRYTLTQRLALFRHVCAGLQHAHQKGIIHLDLKPSNVLVTLHGTRPLPKIIDFGIARPQDWSQQEREADPVAFSGTLAYMSPEQLDARGNPDTRTDIYAMGAILFELLTDSPIIGPEYLKQARREKRLPLISELNPPAPSALLAGAKNLATLSQQRSTSPRQLLRAVSGDLDWIIAKALAKKKADRYANVAELDKDLQYHLENQPVAAAPGSRAYLARKFISRNRIGVSVAVVLAAVFFSSFAVVTNLWFQADEARRQTRAVLERVEANKHFLLDFLAKPNPNLEAEEVKQRFNDMEKLLEEMPSGQEAAQASHHLVLGRVAFGWGLYDDAKSHLEQSLSLWEKGIGVQEKERFETMSYLARVHRRRSDYQLAENLFLQLLEQQRVSGNALDQLRTRNELASTWTARRRFRQAEQQCLQILASQRTLLGKGHPDSAQTLTGLGNALVGLHRYKQAEHHFDEALAIQIPRLGEDHPQTLATRNNLANCLSGKGAYVQSEALYRQVLETRRRVLYKDHPHTLSTAHGLARTLYQQGRLQEADVLAQWVLSKRRKSLGEHHPKTLATMNNLALLYSELDYYQQGFEMFNEIIVAYKLRPTHPQSLRARSNLGDLLIQWDKVGEAIEVLHETLNLKEEALGISHTSSLITLCTLAEAYQHDGQKDRAEWLFVQTLAYATAFLGAENDWVPRFRGYLAVCRLSRGRLEEARDGLLRCNAYFSRSERGRPPWLDRFWDELICSD